MHVCICTVDSAQDKMESCPRSFTIDTEYSWVHDEYAGTALSVDHERNKKVYGEATRGIEIIGGTVEPPPEMQSLLEALSRGVVQPA
jgi:Las17-binding protein actin regulator